MNKKNKLTGIKTYRILFILWSAVILALTSFPKLKTPVDEMIGVDKIAHFCVYFIFAFLFIKMHLKKHLPKTIKRLWYLAIIVPLFDELHQIPIPGRAFSVWDIFADILGFVALIFIYKKMQRTNRNITETN
ncbi:MAG: VanZ family protein [Candidatus Cloacimonetes bacterium]|nr:VanZ family protein [Candidatus Cloacimonadota bacterium]